MSKANVAALPLKLDGMRGIRSGYNGNMYNLLTPCVFDQRLFTEYSKVSTYSR